MRAARLIKSLVLVALMSLVLSGVLTFLNTGLDAEFLIRWIGAYAAAFPIAFVTLNFVRPVADWIARIITGE